MVPITKVPYNVWSHKTRVLPVKRYLPSIAVPKHFYLKGHHLVFCLKFSPLTSTHYTSHSCCTVPFRHSRNTVPFMTEGGGGGHEYGWLQNQMNLYDTIQRHMLGVRVCVITNGLRHQHTGTLPTPPPTYITVLKYACSVAVHKYCTLYFGIIWTYRRKNKVRE